MEIWKDIKGYEGKYQMSSEREVRRLPFSITQKGYGGTVYTRSFGEKILKQSIDAEGYLYVSLDGDKYRLHWLYYNTFIGDSKGFLIDHIDRNRLNNDPSNLRLVDCKGSLKNRTLKYKPDIQDISKHQKYKDKTKCKIYLLRFSENGKRRNIGYFYTYEEAEKKYRELYNEREKKNRVC